MGLWKGVPLARRPIWLTRPSRKTSAVFSTMGYHNDAPKQISSAAPLPIGRVLEDPPGASYHPVHAVLQTQRGNFLDGKRGGPVAMVVPTLRLQNP